MMRRELVVVLRERAQAELGRLLSTDAASDADREQRLRMALSELVESECRQRALAGAESLDASAREAVARDLFDHFYGLGSLQAYLDDDGVEEVVLNAPDRAFVVYGGGRKERIDPGFTSDAEVRTMVARVVARGGRRVDESSPAVDARLPDGARLHAILPPLAQHACITIRRHRMAAEDLDDLVSLGTLTASAAGFLRAAVASGCNILVSGGTASGKTTTLNALGRAIPAGERVVTIEETIETHLAAALEDCVALEAREANIEGVGEVSIRDLVRHALRMRPTRIVVGEVRGAEALDMLAAMNTGHEGSMGTIHANSARQALSKLRTYVLMAAEQLSGEIAAEMIAETLHLVVHLRLDATGGRRVVQIAEVAGMEAGRVLTNDLFVDQAGVLARTQVHSRIAERFPSDAIGVPLHPGAVERGVLA